MRTACNVVDDVNLSDVAGHVSVHWLIPKVLHGAKDKYWLFSAFVGCWERDSGSLEFVKLLSGKFFKQQNGKSMRADWRVLLRPLDALFTSRYGYSMGFRFDWGKADLRDIVPIWFLEMTRT